MDITFGGSECDTYLGTVHPLGTHLHGRMVTTLLGSVVQGRQNFSLFIFPQHIPNFTLHLKICIFNKVAGSTEHVLKGLGVILILMTSSESPPVRQAGFPE